MKAEVDLTEREVQSLTMFQKYRYEFEQYRDMLNWQEIEDCEEILMKIAAKILDNDPWR